MLQQGQFLNTACLRPLSGREEEWLARHRSSPGAVRVSWLLNSCLLVLGDRPLDLVAALTGVCSTTPVAPRSRSPRSTRRPA